MPKIYGTADGFREYHFERGRDVDDYENDQVQGKLLVATEWLDASFREDFQGLKVAPTTQEREWPRTGVVDYYGYAVSSLTVPMQVERATYEAALRELQSADSLSADSKPKPYKSVSVEGAISVVYGSQDADMLTLQIPIIKQILSSLIYETGGSQSRLSGASVRR